MSRHAVEPQLWAMAFACVLIASSGEAQLPPPTAPNTPLPVSPAPAAPAKEAARLAYARGQTAFAQGQYDAARSAFEEAFAAVPNPIVLLSVSESRAKLGQIKEATAALQRYLALRPDAPDRAQVDAKIAALASTPATATVTSVPPGAELSVDGAPATQKTPAQLEIAPGKHTVAYSLPGYQTGSALLVVEPGARYELEVVLQTALPEAPSPAAAATRTPPPTAASETSSAPIWITGSIGAAGIITGSVLGFLALKEQSDFESNPTESRADHGERLALFADVGFGIGAMALATTAVLLFTQASAVATTPADTDAESSSRPTHRAGLEFIPNVTPSTASATARLRF